MKQGFATSDYHFDLPEELIAQDPLERRSDSRLMVVDKETGEVNHQVFTKITEYIKPGDCLVINNTRVIPARLYGTRVETGARIEFLLLKRLSEDTWETLVRPGKKCRKGTKVSFGEGRLLATVTDQLPDGNRIVRFTYEGIFEEVLDALGEMPLPPYITHKLKDKDRYQTVYAKYDGSAAAPTAGLHFTPELLETLQKKGVRIAEVTLHVGLGTFRPVKEKNILDHFMHEERYEISKEAADIINETKAAAHRVIAVGTTSTRTLEAAAKKVSSDQKDTYVIPGSDSTDIFIYPGYQFQVIDGLITNFHLPESTLLMLVSAFADREKVLAAYEEAVKLGYRFFSFGDAMLLI